MQIILPERFMQAFQSVVTSNEQDLVRLWNVPKAYTTYVRQTLLPAVATDLNLCAYSERDYYWLDAVFYEEADTIHFRTGTYAKFLSVAIDHENYSNGTAIEINKLQLYNTPLKVLITYAVPADQAELLKTYAKSPLATMRRTDRKAEGNGAFAK